MMRGSKLRHRAAALGLACSLGVCMPLSAQTLRDPTVPPAAADSTAAGGAPKLLAVQSGAIAVVVRQGVPYLVMGTRLYAKGQMVGAARIERISETEVWLREDGALRKVSVFDGIERRVNAPEIPVKKPRSRASKAHPKKP
jgi:hypothetical protein